MKYRFIVQLFFLSAVTATISCVKKDNYPGPDASVHGTLIDSVTGQPFESGSNDERMYVLQTNYTKGTPIPFYWDIMSDGTYNNSEVFADTYKIYPTDGAFVPVVYTDSKGNLVDNGSKTIEVKAGQTTTTDFTLTPFLEVSWVGDPVLNADTSVTIRCKVVRGTADPTWIFNLTDVFFFISTTQYVSNNSYDNTISQDVTYSGTTGNAIIGDTISITSKAPLGANRTYFLRVGARTADNINKRYNYTTPKQFDVP